MKFGLNSLVLLAKLSKNPLSPISAVFMAALSVWPSMSHAQQCVQESEVRRLGSAVESDYRQVSALSSGISERDASVRRLRGVRSLSQLSNAERSSLEEQARASHQTWTVALQSRIRDLESERLGYQRRLNAIFERCEICQIPLCRGGAPHRSRGQHFYKTGASPESVEQNPDSSAQTQSENRGPKRVEDPQTSPASRDSHDGQGSKHPFSDGAARNAR